MAKTLITLFWHWSFGFLSAQSIRQALLRNGRLRQQYPKGGNAGPYLAREVKHFTPDASCTWLLTELDPDDPDTAFGLFDWVWAAPDLAASGFQKASQCAGS